MIGRTTWITLVVGLGVLCAALPQEAAPLAIASAARAPAGVLEQAVLTVTIETSKDNTLYENSAGVLSNGAGSYLFTGVTRNRQIRRGIIAFDIAAHIPSGSTITSASLQLTMSRTSSGASDVALHKVLADWGEATSRAGGEGGGGAPAAGGDATWLHTFYDTDLWSTPGGDFLPAASAQTTVVGMRSYDWGPTPAMVADVQGWLDAPESSFGWLLLGDEDRSRTTKRFNTKEHADIATRPQLVVEYVLLAVHRVYLPIIQRHQN